MSVQTGQRPLRIAVVDDDYLANAGISRLLEGSGFEVVGRAYDGAAGLTLIETTRPDIAILDIEMPALDGLELARRIHEDMSSPPRLIAISGADQPSLRQQLSDAGFDAYLTKPAKWIELESLLIGFSSV